MLVMVSSLVARPAVVDNRFSFLLAPRGTGPYFFATPERNNDELVAMTRDQLLALGRLLSWPDVANLTAAFLALLCVLCDWAVGGESNDVYARHVAGLKQKAPPGFTVVEQRPFVVVGDEPPEVVRLRATRTVQWAVDALKREYFERDPEETIDIWLFKDRASYEKHTRRLFQDKPATPFGYYSSVHHALIMNIATGGGTLVHEIVHPFMRANFPACPPWFNEGLASLYEQSGERNGRIRGETNWRLAGLQEAVRAGHTLSFQRLTAMTEGEFYGNNASSNYSQFYAQARYLCYYLQERGLLRKYYREFTANSRKDPTGIESLKTVLGEQDLDAFKKKWEAFVLKLSFP